MDRYESYDAAHAIAQRDRAAVAALLEAAFPEAERRTPEEQRALLENPCYRLLVRRGDAGDIDAFFAWWDLDGFAFGEHFAVSDNLRGQGIGGEMLDRLTAAHARFLLEVELPETDLARRRIGFYRRHGFALNEYAYDQMPLRAGYGPLPLLLMSYPSPLERGEFEVVRRVIYRAVYGCEAE